MGHSVAIWLVGLLAAALSLPAWAIDEPCSACIAVAAELQRRLDAEKPRNHLDLRHRLDKHGKRYGKVIEYKLSELRAVELLDGICDAAGNTHVLVRVEEPPSAAEDGADGGSADKPAEGKKAKPKAFKLWTKPGGEGSLVAGLGAKRSYDAEQVQHRELTNFCGALMDKHEDDIVAALQADDFGTEQGVAPVMCERIAKRCPEDGVVALDERVEAVIEQRKKAAAAPPPAPAPAPAAGEGGGGEAAAAGVAETNSGKQQQPKGQPAAVKQQQAEGQDEL